MSSDKDITPLGTSHGSSGSGSNDNINQNERLPSRIGNTDSNESQSNGKGNQENLDEEKAVTVGHSRYSSQKRPNRSIEDSLSDDEARGSHARPGLSNLVYESIGDSITVLSTTLPERRAKAPRRLLQAKAYAELVEDRILELERKVQDLSNEKVSLTEEKGSHDGITSIIHIAQLGWTDFSHRTFVNRKDFKGTWKHRPEIDELSRPVIEILVEEPHYGFGLSRSGKPNSDDSLSDLNATGLTKFQSNDFSAEPYQIRIRSKLLLKTLKEITGSNVTTGPHEHRLLLLRPFKLLVHFEQEIRSFIRTMELENSSYDPNNYQGRAANESSGPTAGKQPTANIAFPARETHSSSALGELRLLCTLIDDCLSRPLQLQRGISPSITKVTFDELWYIFKPGYEVRTPGESQIQVYRVAQVTGGRGILKREPNRDLPENLASMKLKEQDFSEGSFIIECFFIHYDGTRFGPVNKTFQIRRFDGERNITMLPIVPLYCYSNEGEIRTRLENRGKRFIELSNPTARAHRKYKGLTLDKNPEQVESEVIIDFELAFIQTQIERPVLGLRDKLVIDDLRELTSPTDTDSICATPGCCGNDIMFGDYQVDIIERNRFTEKHKYLIDDSPESSDELSPEHTILLPPHVYGFILRTRKWATFDIDRLEEIPPSDEGWNNLVIKPYIKDTVLALVKNHERPRDSQTIIQGALSSVDLVQGKGRGLIILLHGEPGVGKTSTAECVAALTGRPLFPITCGDIGDKAESVEKNLEKNFQLAHKWGCVLLLDEADIFLSARTVDDIQRNAIVSVFLRTLEYYSGILFLTTNRVGKIDRAFKSRIHFSLLYKKLNRERTIRIWKNNLRRVQHEFKMEGKEINCKGNEILEFAKKHYKELKESDDLIVWNGRQIRNAFQTAIAIAAYNASQQSGAGGEAVPILDASQFEMVARSAKQFDKYLKNASLGTDAELAKIATEREDDYTSSNEDDTKRPKQRFKKNSRRMSKKRKNSRRNGSDEDSDEDSEKSSDEELEENSNWNSEVTDEEDRRPTKKNRKG